MLFDQVDAAYPDLTHAWLASENNPLVDRQIRRKLYDFMGNDNFVKIKTSNQILKSVSVGQSEQHVTLLHASDIVNVLSKEVFEKLFVHPYIGAFTNFRKIPATLKSLRTLAKCATTLVSSNEDMCHDMSSRQIDASEDIPSENFTCTGVSFGDCSFCQEGLIYTINLYCEDNFIMKSHILEHLRRAGRVTSPESTVYIVAFNSSSDSIQMLTDTVLSYGDWIPSRSGRESITVLEQTLKLG